jgi:hypothetical protein
VFFTTTALLMTPVLYVATVQAADRAWQMIQEQEVFDEIQVRIGGRRGFTAIRSAAGAWSIRPEAPLGRKSLPVGHESSEPAPKG